MQNLNDFLSNYFGVITLYAVSAMSTFGMWCVFAEYRMKIKWIRDYWGQKELETTGVSIKRKFLWKEVALVATIILSFCAATAILSGK